MQEQRLAGQCRYNIREYFLYPLLAINVFKFTEEKLGKSEKTELDAHFESLWERAENTKKYTERIAKNTEAVLIPNPGNRIEDYVYEKIEKQRPSRLSNLEYLG